jgi:release factor glutamine methyltransferase
VTQPSVPPSTAADALRAATGRFEAAGFETPRLDAEVLLRHVLGLDRTALFLRLMEPLATSDQACFAALIERRLAGEPIAYLTGTREFMGLPFAVRPGVLIPRPETERIVEWALAWLQTRPVGESTIVLDVGTGSGAIVLSLAQRLSLAWPALFVGSDRSRAALEIAAENRTRLAPAARVRLVRGDLSEWCAGPIDLLLANLPYLRPDQVDANPELAPEPALALVGGADGLELVRRLVADAPRVLGPSGSLALEIDPSQAARVSELVAAAFPDAAVTVLPDLAGLARHVVAARSASHQPGTVRPG